MRERVVLSRHFFNSALVIVDTKIAILVVEHNFFGGDEEAGWLARALNAKKYDFLVTAKRSVH